MAAGGGGAAERGESFERSCTACADKWVANSKLGRKGECNAETPRAKGNRREKGAAQRDCMTPRFVRERKKTAEWNGKHGEPSMSDVQRQDCEGKEALIAWRAEVVKERSTERAIRLESGRRGIVAPVTQTSASVGCGAFE